MKIIISLFLLTMFSLSGFSQDDFILPKSFIKWEKEQMNKKRGSSDFKYKEVNRTLQITAWVVRQDNMDSATFPISENAIHANIEGLNSYFKPIGLSFVVCNIDTIVDYHYAVLTDTSEHEIMENIPPGLFLNTKPYIGDINYGLLIDTYYEPNTINMYFTDSLYAKALSGHAAGIAFMPGGKDVIYMSGSAGIQTYAHEMGHFLGLYHTHEDKAYGPEYANGTNCHTAGDLLCDTPAEPNMAEYTGDDCKPTPNMPKDPNGQTYIPNIGNIMSYSTACRWGFTKQQYEKMVISYYHFKTHLR